MLEESYAVSDALTSYFAFSRRRTGYSGVATYCKLGFTPIKAEEGLTGTLQTANNKDGIGGLQGIEEEFTSEDLKQLDAEGRAVLTMHQLESGHLVVINVYCPRADCETPDREIFQLKFLKLLGIRASNLASEGHKVVIVGDINVSHKRIDHCEPCDDFELRQSRRWMDNFVGEYKADEEECPIWKVIYYSVSTLV